MCIHPRRNRTRWTSARDGTRPSPIATDNGIITMMILLLLLLIIIMIMIILIRIQILILLLLLIIMIMIKQNIIMH